MGSSHASLIRIISLENPQKEYIYIYIFFFDPCCALTSNEQLFWEEKRTKKEHSLNFCCTFATV